MAERDRQVCIVSDHLVLASGLAGALRAVGWPDVPVLTGSSFAAAPAARVAPTVVLVADEGGPLPDWRRRPAGVSGAAVAAVGGPRAFAGLADAVERGWADAAISADQPFPDLVREVDVCLRGARPGGDRSAAVDGLRRREDEARRCASLSGREQAVLGALAIGHVAAEIAEEDHVSMATVRTQIRAVLSKLGVSSQLAAAAMAHRSCREEQVLTQLRQVHQFWR